MLHRSLMVKAEISYCELEMLRITKVYFNFMAFYKKKSELHYKLKLQIQFEIHFLIDIIANCCSNCIA